MSGFRKTEIAPFDRDIFEEHEFSSPSDTTDRACPGSSEGTTTAEGDGAGDDVPSDTTGPAHAAETEDVSEASDGTGAHGSDHGNLAGPSTASTPADLGPDPT